MASDERRAHERKRADISVHVTLTDDATFEGRIENIGEYGVFFTSTNLDSSIEAGDKLALRFQYKGTDFERDGSVVRIDQEFSAGEVRRSIAIRFDIAI